MATGSKSRGGARNPSGYALSGDEAYGLVQYRPRLSDGRRVTLHIPRQLAEDLQREPDVAKRHKRALAGALRGPTPRAREIQLDTSTGQKMFAADAGTRPTGLWIMVIEGREVAVDPEDLSGKATRRGRRVDLGGPVDYLSRARAAPRPKKPKAKASLKCPPRIPGLPQTYRTAKSAARTFYDENSDFFDGVSDPWDGIRDWMDGVEARSGGKTQRLYKTRAGASILGERHAENAIVRALQYVFGRTKSRRWDEVDWDLIDRLGESLEPYFEPVAGRANQGGLYWKPFVGDLEGVAVESLTSEQWGLLSACESQEEIHETITALESAYEANRDCLPRAHQRIVERRLEEWSAWARDPRKIPDYACAPDPGTGGMTCDYPAVAGELRALRDACETGYDPAWAKPLGSSGTPGFSGARQSNPSARSRMLARKLTR